MESKSTGRDLGGQSLHGFRARSAFFVVGAFFLVALNSLAHAQTCPTAPCTSDGQCNDGLFCTVDFCFNPGPSGNCNCVPNSCDDGSSCTNDVCNEGTNACEHTNICQAPTPFCSSGECVECLNAGHCAPPEPRCSSSGECVECTNSVQCQDSSYCNGFESCNLSTGLCEAGTPVTCAKTCFMGPTPGAACTTDQNCGSGGRCLGQCNDTRAACVQCKVDSNCDDGKFCNGAETCVNDQCVVGTPPACKKCVGGSEQGQPCTTDAECGNPPGPGTCTGASTPCDEASNQCVQCLNPTQCDDLNYCTNNACVFNACVFTPSEAICSDGAFCNGVEACTYVVGNPCSIFNDRAHCCSDGPDPVCGDDFSCTVDICNETNDSCQHTPNNTLCPGSSLACNGTEICNPGALGADPATGCLAGTPISCPADTDCSTFVCVENPPPAHCVGQAINQGIACNDNSPCTALSKCNNGSCVDNPPTTSPPDPWRCVRLEWRAAGPTTVLAGGMVELGLYAVAIGCNTAHDSYSNKRCVGGAVNGNTCITDANCRVCVGGTNAGAECTTPAPCSGGGTCPAGGTCTDLCPATALPVNSVEALFTWNKTFLQLNPATGPEPNPEDGCASPTGCNLCPLNTYNWTGTGGFSGWVNDCGGDGLNAPCNAGVPSLNDGNARYLGFRGTNLSCPDGCATTAGMLVSTIKFKAISGGTSSIALLPCFGVGSKTKAISPVVFDGVPTSDVTKNLGPGISITVTCDSVDDCNDNNPCTNDSCSCNTPNCGGNCNHPNNTNSCDDGLFCTGPDGCAGGICQGPQVCKKCVGGPDAGKPCFTTAQCGTPGTCTGAPSFCEENNDRCVECLSVANCNDGLGGTIDTCEDGLCVHTPVDCDDAVPCTVDQTVEPSGACTHTPNHAFCNPLNSFCSSAICDLVEGCILDHECISLDGNPCPDPATCNETTNTCGGCNQPVIVVAGPRYLSVTPASQGSTPVALVVAGDCADPIAACVYRYVQSKCLGGTNNGLDCDTDADCPKRCVGGQFPNAACTVPLDCPQGECQGRCDAGSLGSTPYYKTTAQWGTAKVRGAQIRPGTKYMMHTLCDFPGGTVLSSAASAKTWKWGDVDNDAIVNAIDVANMVNAFKGFFGPYTFEQMNLFGCTPDSVLNALDIAVCVDAVRGFAFPCSLSCP